MSNKVRETRQLLKMQDKKYTQEFCARFCGVTLGAYQSIENYHVDPKVSTALKIAKLFNTTVEKLFSD